MFVIEPTEPRLLLSAVQTGSIVTVHGTPGNDVIQVWNNSSDTIVSVNGDQSSFSRDGLKLIRIYGERGDDTITALPGSEALTVRLSIDAGAGNDSITGGAGNDTIIGNMGNDTVNGGGGADFLDYRYVNVPQVYSSSTPMPGVTINLTSGQAAEPGGYTDSFTDIHGVLGSQDADNITGTTGDDSLLGFGGNDTIHGDGGDDLIRGGSGGDKLFGGTGNDTILGDLGKDFLHGDGGDDSLSGGKDGETNTFDQADYDAGHIVDFQPGVDALV